MVPVAMVKCTENPLCSGYPVTVTITDQCPGGPCAAEAVHFDMSGTAFGALALPGKASQLQSAGAIPVEYSRIPCHYNGYTIAFKVDGGSTAYYFAVLVEFEGGDGDLSAVELKQFGGSQGWLRLEQSWGATWKLNSGSPLTPPLSIRLTTLASHAVVVADDVIPVGWKAGATYRSHVS
ncbi:hypothetical protein HPP92_014489 [Vanilla planifolia]|uniref:Uncharacterized protein n=1 Tax=Vanilla planifolia TaxID=51239 RepID=A0A835QRQ7_VANPL|nr:hypothetical protein HPP92_014489 [Vanilla planifolia]